MTQPNQPIAIDRRKEEAARMAEIRHRIDNDDKARQEAIADFILSMAEMAKQLREALDIRATVGNAEAMPNLNPFIHELTYRIRFYFREAFGRDLFDCPPANEHTAQQPADYQAAMLRAASEQARTTQPVPGWPVVITANTDNNGYFTSMRRNHPVKLGEVINSKRVVETFWFNCDEDGDQPVYRLEGEEGYRLASDIAGRITWASCPAPITPPAAPDQQPPTDGGE